MSGSSNLPRRGHDRRNSFDTQASGLSLGGSAISFSGFSNRFPIPPSSVPASPISGVFPSVSPLVPRRTGDQSPLSQTGSTSHLRDEVRTISPHDWHEGASCISVDATEHSLLSTSFITTLLRDNPDPNARASHRVSLASDFSEMTYPPPRTQTTVRTAPTQRPQGARPPPSSFLPIPESSALASDDDTLYSNHEADAVVRTASISRPLRGTPVAGVASATLRNVKATSSAPSYGIKDDMDFTPHSSLPVYSPALPSTAGPTRRFLPETAPELRTSMHSTRSLAPSFISAAGSAIRRAFIWRKKPLPPIPKIPHIPVAQEAEFKQKDEAAPLSQLLLRSDALRTALDSGQNPHNSFVSQSPASLPVSAFDDHSAVHMLPQNGRPSPAWSHGPSSPQLKANKNVLLKKRRIWIIMCLFAAVALGAVGAAVGITLHNRKGTHKETSCSGNLAGVACNLDATCVCTSPVANRCDGLAQNLVTLTPTMNSLFGTNYTTNDVYLWIWTSQGTITAKNCASQAVLVDVGAAPDLTKFPNRTAWAQSALLWDLQSLNTTSLQEFVVDAPWSLFTSDGQVNATNPSLFTTIASGYQFNFASQTLSVPSISFVTDGAPTSSQASAILNTAPLDRMYSVAAAASTQYQGLLQSYWTTTLQRTLDKLPLFKAGLSSSPIMIPFNVETSSVRSLLTSSDTFPVPIACYSGLSAAQIQDINALEGVFGLSPLTSSASQFEPSCFPTRPVYGVLNILRLRLPFADSRTNVTRQAVTLQPDTAPRAVVYSGEILSAFPGTPNISSEGISLDPRTYGTLNHFDHVVLQFLSSMPTLVANAVVDFVLSNSTVPPTSSSVLYSETIPALEVAVFGTIAKTDVDWVSAGFADAAGSLVFGTSNGDALRTWGISGASSLLWTELSNSSLVVHDPNATSNVFTQTWEATASALQTHDIVGVFNITNALGGLFSP